MTAPRPRFIPARRHFLRLSSLLAASACLAPTVYAESAPRTLRVGFVGAGAGTPPVPITGGLGIAQIKGFITEEFARDGVRVEFAFYKAAGPAVNESIAAGKLDLALQGDVPALIGRSVGLDTKILATTTRHQNIYLAVPSDSTIQRIEDLRGRKVVIPKGTYMQLPADQLLEAHGLSEADLRTLNLDTPSALAALSTRNIDAAFLPSQVLVLRDKKQVRIVHTNRDDPVSSASFTYLLGATPFVQRYPETAQRFLKAWLRGVRWAAEPAYHSETLDIWSRSGLPASIFAEDLGAQSLQAQLNPLLDPFVIARSADIAAQSFRLKILRAPVEVASWFEPAPLNAALKALALEHYWQAQAAPAKRA